MITEPDNNNLQKQFKTANECWFPPQRHVSVKKIKKNTTKEKNIFFEPQPMSEYPINKSLQFYKFAMQITSKIRQQKERKNTMKCMLYQSATGSFKYMVISRTNCVTSLLGALVYIILLIESKQKYQINNEKIIQTETLDL